MDYLCVQTYSLYSWEGRQLATGPDSKKPAFDHEFIKHSNDLPLEFHRCGVSKVMTYDEREYEWLRSFLEVVTWMEKKFGAVEIPVEEEVKDSSVAKSTK